ncbi:MAG: Holliday junction resolvase RuvX [Eubacteriaceae bacterium]|nr:Holliday junction resolvase RuvX [Eubacteriaceae bacterium]
MSYELKERILCLDLGGARIGAAVSDPFGITAQAVATIQAKPHYIDEIGKLLEKYSATKIVIGYPIETSGKEGKQAKSVKSKAEAISKQLNCEVELFDERFSTKQAQRIMQSGNVSERDQKNVIDMLSAQVILQSYLEMRSVKNKRNERIIKGVVKLMDDNKIVLIGENNEEIEFMVDDEFEFEGAKYLVLCEDEESEDALLFRLDEGDDGEMLLVEVSDDVEFDKVSKYYFEN